MCNEKPLFSCSNSKLVTSFKTGWFINLCAMTRILQRLFPLICINVSRDYGEECVLMCCLLEKFSESVRDIFRKCDGSDTQNTIRYWTY